jgi:hypothetical protein
VVSLGDLWRESGQYRDNEALTHYGNSIMANEQQIKDAESFAETDRKGRDFNYWLTLILTRDYRIAQTGFDDEENAT